MDCFLCQKRPSPLSLRVDTDILLVSLKELSLLPGVTVRDYIKSILTVHEDVRVLYTFDSWTFCT